MDAGIWNNRRLGFTKIRRGAMKSLLYGIVESTDRGKAGGESDMRDGDIGFDDRFSGKMESVTVGYLFGRFAEFFFKQSSEMPGADSQPLGKAIFVGFEELIVGDEFKGPLDYGAFSNPSG